MYNWEFLGYAVWLRFAYRKDNRELEGDGQASHSGQCVCAHLIAYRSLSWGSRHVTAQPTSNKPFGVPWGMHRLAKTFRSTSEMRVCEQVGLQMCTPASLSDKKEEDVTESHDAVSGHCSAFAQV